MATSRRSRPIAAAAAVALALLAAPRGARAAVVAFYTDSACATAAQNTAQAFTDACLPVPLAQEAIYLTSCNSSAVVGSLFAAYSMAAPPPCTGAAQVFTATATCAAVPGVASSLYVKATDFTCTSNGLAYVMQHDPAAAACSSVAASLVRYLPVVATASATCIAAYGTAGNRFDMTVVPGATVNTLSVSVFTSTNGGCSSQTASFTNMLALGSCTAADTVSGSSVAKGMTIWPATPIMCPMRAMTGYDVIGPQLSKTFETTEAACAMRCCVTSGCLGYSFAKGMLGTPVLVPQAGGVAVTTTSVAQTYADPWNNQITSNLFVPKFDPNHGESLADSWTMTHTVPVLSAGTGTSSPITATVVQALCQLLSNATALVPSNMMTGAVMPSVVTS
jgi:hypothetical protein